MSVLKRTFVVCSDIHTRVSSTNNAGLYVYRKEHENKGYDIYCCGDFAYDMGGMAKEPKAEDLLKEYCKLGGLVCAGNHETYYDFGGGGIARWLYLTGYEGYQGDQYTNVKTIDGDLYVSVSGYCASNSTATGQYTQKTMDTVLCILQGNTDKRIFLFTHYPCCMPYNVSGVTADCFGARVGTNSDSLPFNSQFPYPAPTNFFKEIATYPNVIWFSGHTHTDWKLQEENINYRYNKVDHWVGPYPNIKVYKVPDGAYMINLPSHRWRSQDAIVRVYDDKVVVTARQAYTADGQIVNLKTETGHTYSGTAVPTWAFEEMDTRYQYTWDVPTASYVPGEPDEPDIPSGGDGLLSVPVRLPGGGVATTFDELPASVRGQLDRSGTGLWYFGAGLVPVRITWDQNTFVYAVTQGMDGVLTVDRCLVEQGTDGVLTLS